MVIKVSACIIINLLKKYFFNLKKRNKLLIDLKVLWLNMKKNYIKNNKVTKFNENKKKKNIIIYEFFFF